MFLSLKFKVVSIVRAMSFPPVQMAARCMKNAPRFASIWFFMILLAAFAGIDRTVASTTTSSPERFGIFTDLPPGLLSAFQTQTLRCWSVDFRPAWFRQNRKGVYKSEPCQKSYSESESGRQFAVLEVRIVSGSEGNYACGNANGFLEFPQIFHEIKFKELQELVATGHIIPRLQQVRSLTVAEDDQDIHINCLRNKSVKVPDAKMRIFYGNEELKFAHPEGQQDDEDKNFQKYYHSIDKVQKEHTGNFTCRYGNLTADFHLAVSYGPISGSVVEETFEDNLVRLTCKLVGQPQPTVFEWRNPKGEIQPETGVVLKLVEVTRLSTGTWSCSAQNTYNQTVDSKKLNSKATTEDSDWSTCPDDEETSLVKSKPVRKSGNWTIDLRVHHMPKLVKREPSIEVRPRFQPRMEIIIYCEVVSLDEPIMFWWRDLPAEIGGRALMGFTFPGGKIKSRFQVFPEVGTSIRTLPSDPNVMYNYTWTSRLRIYPAQKGDNGTYRCEVKNKVDVKVGFRFNVKAQMIDDVIKAREGWPEEDDEGYSPMTTTPWTTTTEPTTPKIIFVTEGLENLTRLRQEMVARQMALLLGNSSEMTPSMEEYVGYEEGISETSSTVVWGLVVFGGICGGLVVMLAVVAVVCHVRHQKTAAGEVAAGA